MSNEDNNNLDPTVQAVVNALYDRSRFEPSFIKTSLVEKTPLQRVAVRPEPAPQMILEEDDPSEGRIGYPAHWVPSEEEFKRMSPENRAAIKKYGGMKGSGGIWVPRYAYYENPPQLTRGEIETRRKAGKEKFPSAFLDQPTYEPSELEKPPIEVFQAIEAAKKEKEENLRRMAERKTRAAAKSETMKEDLEQTEEVPENAIVVDIYEENGKIVKIDNGVIFVNEPIAVFETIEKFRGADSLLLERGSNVGARGSRRGGRRGQQNAVARGTTPATGGTTSGTRPGILQRIGTGISNIFRGNAQTPQAASGTQTSPAASGTQTSPAASGFFSNVGNFFRNNPIGQGIGKVAGDAILGGIGSKLTGGKFSDGAKAGAVGSLVGQVGGAAADRLTGGNETSAGGEQGGGEQGGGAQGGGAQGGGAQAGGGSTAPAGRGRTPVPVNFTIDGQTTSRDDYAKERAGGNLDQQVQFTVKNKKTQEKRVIKAPTAASTEDERNEYKAYYNRYKQMQNAVLEHLIRIGAFFSEYGVTLNNQLYESVTADVYLDNIDSPYYYDTYGRLRIMSESESYELRLAETIYSRLLSEEMDEVGSEDEDVDNDGDSDESDEYLKNRREKIAAKMKGRIDEIAPLVAAGARYALPRLAAAAGRTQIGKKVKNELISKVGDVAGEAAAEKLSDIVNEETIAESKVFPWRR